MTRTHDKPLELLAPAGDWLALKAAVANGADAVYFGLGQFNARARAANFTVEELPEVVGFLHGHNVKGYVALNVLIFADELEQAAKHVAAIAASGADAVIVQDLGLATLIGRMCPSLPLHASTQMTLSDGRAVAMAKSLGVRRAILPRELSMAEIAALAATTDLELEVFAHGAMCISFSGQCWASASFWGRSGNRGQCGQACRLPYQLVVNRHVAGDAKQYLLSPKDLAAHDLVKQLTLAGADGLKIEGRLKGEHYVAAACAVYRQAIDAAAAGKEFRISQKQERELAQGFSRGFSHGFLAGTDHRDLVEGQSPKPRGLRLGRVARFIAGGIVIHLDDGVERPKAGDGIVFEVKARNGDRRDFANDSNSKSSQSPSPDAESSQVPTSGEPGGRLYSVGTSRGGRPDGPDIEITLDNALDLSAVAVGDVVWKTDDPQVRRDLEQTFARTQVLHPSVLSVVAEAQAGQVLRVTFRDDAGNEATVQSERPMEAALNQPLTVELLKEQFGRLGGTPFALGVVRLAGDADRVDVLAPKSLLNQLRRDAVARLMELRAERAKHPIVEAGALVALRAETVTGLSKALPADLTQVHVLARTVEQVQTVASMAANDGRHGTLHLDFADMKELDEAIAVATEAHLPFGIATPRILKPNEEPLLEQLASRQPVAWLVRNLGSLSWLHEHCPDATLVGDAGLNVANELSAGFLVAQGLSRVTPAYELSDGRMEAMVRRSAASVFEVIIHQHVPLFHMAHCLFARLSGSADCSQCPHPCRQHDLRLRDRNEVDHPVRVDLAGRTTVFRGEIESRIDRLPTLRRIGVGHARVEFLDESSEAVSQILGKVLSL